MNLWNKTRGGAVPALTLLLASLGASHPASATSLATPILSDVKAGHGKVAITVTAGNTGAPAGFATWWMKESDFLANGSNWFAAGGSPLQHEAYFTGRPIIHTEGGTLHSFQLAADASARVEIGDLFDETGLTTNSREDLVPGESFVFSAFAMGTLAEAASTRTPNEEAITRPSIDCTYTRGWWLAHPESWPPFPPNRQMPGRNRAQVQVVSDPVQVVMGSVVYTRSETLNILFKPSGILEPDRPSRGGAGSHGAGTVLEPPNGLIALAHQLIAARLNQFNGASVPPIILNALVDADNLIGSKVCPPVGEGFLDPLLTQALTQLLSDYNNGLNGTGQCITTAVRAKTWGELRRGYR